MTETAQEIRERYRQAKRNLWQPVKQAPVDIDAIINKPPPPKVVEKKKPPVRLSQLQYQKELDEIIRLSGYDLNDLRSSSRRKDLVYWRAMYINALHKLGWGASHIGRHLRRDHSTICVSLKKYGYGTDGLAELKRFVMERREKGRTR